MMIDDALNKVSKNVTFHPFAQKLHGFVLNVV